MKKASTLAYIYATKCNRNEIDDSVPFLQVIHCHYRISKTGEVLRKCDTEVDTGTRKKLYSGQWLQIGRMQEEVKDKEKLSEMLSVWQRKLEQMNFDVEVEIYEDQHS